MVSDDGGAAGGVCLLTTSKHEMERGREKKRWFIADLCGCLVLKPVRDITVESGVE